MYSGTHCGSLMSALSIGNGLLEGAGRVLAARPVGMEENDAAGTPPASLLEDAAVDAIVCGHLHKTANYEREVGAHRTPAYIVGWTGGLHGAASMFGMLSVPARGRITWETRAV